MDPQRELVCAAPRTGSSTCHLDIESVSNEHRGPYGISVGEYADGGFVPDVTRAVRCRRRQGVERDEFRIVSASRRSNSDFVGRGTGSPPDGRLPCVPPPRWPPGTAVLPDRRRGLALSGGTVGGHSAAVSTPVGRSVLEEVIGPWAWWSKEACLLGWQGNWSGLTRWHLTGTVVWSVAVITARGHAVRGGPHETSVGRQVSL
jgi:hypothetical protein